MKKLDLGRIAAVAALVACYSHPSMGLTTEIKARAEVGDCHAPLPQPSDCQGATDYFDENWTGLVFSDYEASYGSGKRIGQASSMASVNTTDRKFRVDLSSSIAYAGAEGPRFYPQALAYTRILLTDTFTLTSMSHADAIFGVVFEAPRVSGTLGGTPDQERLGDASRYVASITYVEQYLARGLIGNYSGNYSFTREESSASSEPYIRTYGSRTQVLPTGTPVNLTIMIEATAKSFGASASAAVAYGHTIDWGGIVSVVDLADGSPVTDWVLTSESGVRWDLSSPVPNPPSLLLVAIGGALIAVPIRRRADRLHDRRST